MKLTRISFPRIVFSLIFLSPAYAFATEWDIVHAGKLLAIPGEKVENEKSVILKDGKVFDVRDGFIDSTSLPINEKDTIEVHDLRDNFVLPGFIDGHVHLTLYFTPKERINWVNMSDADIAIRGAKYAKETLLAGFTSVRDMGAFTEDAVYAIRDGINEGHIVGPRTFVSGHPIAINGGHGDITHSFNPAVSNALRTTGICDGAAECRKAVREQIRLKADHIKLTATAGVMSDSNAGLELQFFEDELEAIVKSAQLMGRKVAAHAHGPEGINAVLRAGANTIEHGTFLNDESIELFKSTGAYLSPTMSAFLPLMPLVDDPNSFLTESQREKAEEAVKFFNRYVRKAHKAGVKIALSTDAGVGPHGANGIEFRLLVEYGGMTPMEAIKAGTINGADNLGKLDELGSLEKGKWGDVVAVDGDPLQDISVLENVNFVMKGGKVFKNATL